jgi:ankyrin repeat protein/N-acetylneuraminic acid mutarotase
MKTSIALLLGIFVGGFAGLAGTNDTASALQRGLFEEEANQNLPAAIQAYRAVAGQFDKDRKLAATAVFRLGECYRKQGSTNDAAAQYERVLRDFSDQPQLVTLSRQQLRAFGSPAAADNGGAGGTGSSRADAAALEAQLTQFKAMTKDQLRVAVQQSYPNPVLTSLMQNLNAAEQTLAVAEKEYGPQHQEVIKDSEVVKTIRSQVDAQVDAALKILEVKRQSLAAAAKAAPAASALDDGVDTSRLASTERDEVMRIQTMIKDSPDLINAKNGQGETPLYDAAKKGKLVVAKFLLANGAVVDASSVSETPLHAAAREGHKAMAELLLDYKAPQKQAYPGQTTPLHLAAGSGYRSVTELLLDRGADVNAKADGATPLMWAVRDGFRAVAELLIARGADVNAEATNLLMFASTLRNNRFMGSPLQMAVFRGDLPVVELLLSNKADVAFTGRAGVTALFRTAQNGNVAVAEALVSHGADVNARMTGKDSQGWTALHQAVAYRQKEMVEFLLKNQADPNARIDTEYGEGGPGYTPLLIATARVFPELVDALLANKADPNLGNGTRYPILNALNNEDPAARKLMVKSLLDHGVQLEVRDTYGNTPLLLAASRNDPEALALLIDAHANVNAQDKNGRSALHLVANNRDPAVALECGKRLLRAGANPNLRDSDGNTPLLLAVDAKRSDLVELLLANNADPNAQNNQGQTALDRSGNPRPGSLPAGIPVPRRATPPAIINPATGLPVGVSTTTLPDGSITINVDSTSGNEPNKPPATIADMLRQHGGLGKLPSTNQIVVSRPSANYSEVVFTKPPTNENRFSLYELIAVKYGRLSDSPRGDDVRHLPGIIMRGSDQLKFPDFTRVKIRRLSDDRKRWEEKTLNVAAALGSGDCSGDVPLKWGDVVEIPEADHLLGDVWRSLPESVLESLKNCLTRHVQISVKGQMTNMDLAPFTAETGSLGRLGFWSNHSFMLSPVLRSSGLLLASSDLSRVKVTRRDSRSGTTNEWIIDCSSSADPPDFWVLDGDQIDVPERASAQEPAGPLTPARPLTPSNRQVTPPRARARAQAASNPFAPPVAQDGPLEAEDRPAAPQISNPALPRRAIPPAAGSLEQQYLSVDGVLYSPEREDSRLQAAGYALDAAAETRTGQAWAERAPAGIQSRAGNTVVWTGREMIVFGGEGPGASFDNGARYNPRDNSWEILPPKNAPSSRTGASAVWTDREMIVWGGFGGRLGNNTNRSDGSRYDPTANVWKPMSNQNAPEARFDFSAVWSGKEMLVWGGYTDSQSRYSGAYAPGHLNTGGRYHPSNDSWKSISTKSAPSKRFAHAAVWTGKEMLIWGGADSSKVLGDGGRYDPSKDAWRPIASAGAPSARGNPVAVWTGREMIVWGGATRDNNAPAVYFRDGARYDPVKDKWTPMSQANAPKGRVQAASCWTGKVLVVWGGVNDVEAKGLSDSNRYLGGGALYNPETDTWSPITNAGAPSPRLTSGVWTGDNLLFFGGYNGLHLDETWSFSPSVMLYPYAKK